MIAAAQRKWLALALLLGVQFMVVLDIAIVNVALPSIQKDLGFSERNLQWIVSAYALLFGGLLLLGGRVADLLGRRRLFIAGLIVFTVASLTSGLAWSEAALIGARALQGFGAALITPAALSILTTTFTEGKERNAALGAWGAVGAFGAVAGVLLGGVLTSALSWHWIFYVNVPVGVLGLALAPFFLTESRDAHAKSFDIPGAALAAQLVTRVGVKPVLVVGMTALSAGLLYFAQVSVDGTYLRNLLPGFLLISVGIGFSFVPISIAALAGVQAAEAGLASGLINTSQQIGGALGIAALTSIATSTTNTKIASGASLPTALTEGFQSAFYGAAGVAILGILVALFVVRRRDLVDAIDAELALE